MSGNAAALLPYSASVALLNGYTGSTAASDRSTDAPATHSRAVRPSDWIFEPKYDGFRAIARIEGHRCTLTSRNGHTFKSWPQLCEELPHAFQVCRAVTDGEIVCLDAQGRIRMGADCLPAWTPILDAGSWGRSLRLAREVCPDLLERLRRTRYVIVLYGRNVTAIAGQWRRVADNTAAGGEAVAQPDIGAPTPRLRVTLLIS
jgi:hypothetical protein